MRNPADSPATKRRPKTMPKAMDNVALLLPREESVGAPEVGVGVLEGSPNVAPGVEDDVAPGVEDDVAPGVEDDVASDGDKSAAAVITSPILMLDDRSSHAPKEPLPSQNANACRTPIASMRVCNSATADAALL
jgi:hypothetical protein